MHPTHTTPYPAIVSCPLACKGVIRDKATNIPRGFFTLGEPGSSATILVVALNPATPKPDSIEQGIYASKSAVEIVETHLSFCNDHFLNNYGRTFHKRLLKWLSEILNLPGSEVFKYAVYTNLVKCSTHNNEAPDNRTIETCAAKHLRAEINYWKPKLIIALGSKVAKSLAKLHITYEYLPHPSNRESTEDNMIHVANLKAKLLSIR